MSHTSVTIHIGGRDDEDVEIIANPKHPYARISFGDSYLFFSGSRAEEVLAGIDMVAGKLFELRKLMTPVIPDLSGQHWVPDPGEEYEARMESASDGREL